MSLHENEKSSAKETSLSGTETHKSLRPDAENEGKVPLKGAGIGALFRKQREKLGLSHTRISKTTRIRPYILEALENENWEVLPSSVFVTGFIRSYARTLGLEQEEIVALYQKNAPANSPPARPLVEPPRSKKAPFIIFVFLLLAMASAYYLWKEYPAHEKVTTVPETINTAVDGGTNLKDTRNVQQETGQAFSSEQKEPAASPVTSPPDTFPSRLNSTPEPGTQPSDMEPSEDLSGGEESHDPVTVFVAGSDLLILKATVRERTYIRMVVDAREPKEYVFRAGSNPQWEAREGFDVLIGNAGGINFEFNGKKIQDLGRTGEVVHLRFPKNVRSQE